MARYDVSMLAMAVLLVLLAGRVWQLWQLGRKEVKQKNPRQLRPRTPEDYPYCRQEHETVCSVLPGFHARKGSPALYEIYGFGQVWIMGGIQKMEASHDILSIRARKWFSRTL